MSYDRHGRTSRPSFTASIHRHIETLESRTLFSADVQALAAAGFTPLQWGDQQTYVKSGEWILHVNGIAGKRKDQLNAINALLQGAGAGLTASQHLGVDGMVLVKSAAAASFGQLRKLVGGIKGFDYLEPDFAIELQATPATDPSYPSLYALNNTGQTGGTPDADIDAPEAWSLSTGSSGVVVAVLDSGIDYNHPDLAPNMWHNAGEVAGDGIDNDGNGYVDDVYGYDAINLDSNPMDDHSHGTHVSGTIGAHGDSTGVVGVNWNTSLMAVKMIDASGYGDTASAIRGIDYVNTMKARGVNVRVCNASWGGDPFAQSLYDAIGRLRDNGILFVAAAGNGNVFGQPINNDTTKFYPASYNLDNVIAVAATTRTDGIASFSNYGATEVDLGAPGVGIYSTVLNGGYENKDGTSMAAPHVTGVAALAAAAAPGATYLDIRSAILNGVDKVSSLSGKTVTGGRLNAHNTLQLLLPPSAAHDAPTLLTTSAVSSTQINLSWADNSANETGFVVERSTDQNLWEKLGSDPVVTVGANVKSFADTTAQANSTYYYRVRAVNDLGASTDSNIATAVTTIGNGTGLTGDYYGDTTLTALKMNRLETINYQWNTGSPGGPLGTDNFSARWTGQIQPRFSETYTFHANTDDGVRLWVDGQLLIDHWQANTTPISAVMPYTFVAGQKYDIKMEYYEGTGGAYAQLSWSSASEAKQIIPASQLYPTSSVYPAAGPAAPTGITATAAGTTQVNVSWKDNSVESGFLLERSTSSTFTSVVVIPLPANTTSYADTGLTSGTTYYYRIRSTRDGVNSTYSGVVSATPAQPAPAAPSNLVARAISRSRVDLTWQDNSANETGFRIQRATNSSFTSGLVTFTTGANATSFSVTGLSRNKQYYFRVQAYNAAGNSAWTSTATARTLTSLAVASNDGSSPSSVFSSTRLFDSLEDALT